MSTIKKLGAVPMTAAEITKSFPMTLLEHFVIIQNLYEGGPAGNEELARKRRDLYQVLAKDWDWAVFEADGGLKRTDFEDPYEATLTKAQLKTLQDFATVMAAQLPGKFAMAALDVCDRVHYVLTSE